jgi:hypothetical protein
VDPVHRQVLQPLARAARLLLAGLAQPAVFHRGLAVPDQVQEAAGHGIPFALAARVKVRDWSGTAATG